ncbi:hypothetical protein [Pseudogracilibacillus sp. ICA-222130]|uniref:hypothetical protein n=1 Tax=Pseudogracilibacillus sp. ICA-222130 TaxID=3134655 RepID=UPI0030C15E0F
MIAQTNLSYITTALTNLKEKISPMVQPIQIETDTKFICFLSIGNPSIRARVLCEINQSLDKVFQNLEKKAIQFVRKNHLDPEWMKIDYVTNVEQLPFQQLEQKFANTRRNYFRYGIAFDEQFQLAFLEQEINGNALIRQLPNKKIGLHDKNVNHYLKVKQSNKLLFMKEHYRNKNVYIFETKSYFKERTEEHIHDLYNGPLSNGLRKTTNMKDEVAHLIEKSTQFLTRQVGESGKFQYGYFSAFGKSIANYNILRHASSLYAMMEGYEIIRDEKVVQAVERGLNYLIDSAIVYKNEDTAFVVEHANNGEIKLGSNATAILAMTKYMTVTGNDNYLEIAQALARGIIEMKLPDSSFIHVLQYPGFEIKEMNRIIYYEGEAIFALLRLYAIDKKPQWLEEVKDSFDYFMKKDYWKYHDHWLSYAANELVTYAPEDAYFEFGLKNCHDRLQFIYHRETTFPTFLELTMAAYKMIHRMKELGKEYLLDNFDENFLVETIDRRAEFQRVGFFYPEQAMYMKQPSLILDGFFIRHHSFRVRIDDVEHYLSGYCQYYHERIGEQTNIEALILDV